MNINKILANFTKQELRCGRFNTKTRSDNMKCITDNRVKMHVRHYTEPAGDPGAGAGRGGGAGGSVREAGGGLGKLGAANEEGYFFNEQKKQLEKLKEKLKGEPKNPPEVTQK